MENNCCFRVSRGGTLGVSGVCDVSAEEACGISTRTSVVSRGQQLYLGAANGRATSEVTDDGVQCATKKFKATEGLLFTVVL